MLPLYAKPEDKLVCDMEMGRSVNCNISYMLMQLLHMLQGLLNSGQALLMLQRFAYQLLMPNFTGAQLRSNHFALYNHK